MGSYMYVYSRKPRRGTQPEENSEQAFDDSPGFDSGDSPEDGGGGAPGRDNAGQAAGDDIEETVLNMRPAPLRAGRRGGGLSRITADRPIFTLSVAADLLGLHPRTLRIYEEKRLVVPARTEGNRRRYSQNDIQRFHAIRRLTQGGVNLEGVRIILDMAEELTRLGGDPAAIIDRNLEALEEFDEL